MKTPRPTATPITLEDLQAIVDRWITTTGGGYFSELTNAVILAEETGEAARILASTATSGPSLPTIARSRPWPTSSPI